MKALTVEQAKVLRIGQYVYHMEKKNADGSPMRARVLSVKTWKRDAGRVLVSAKRGLYDYAKFDESEIYCLSAEEK